MREEAGTISTAEGPVIIFLKPLVQLVDAMRTQSVCRREQGDSSPMHFIPFWLRMQVNIIPLTDSMEMKKNLE